MMKFRTLVPLAAALMASWNMTGSVVAQEYIPTERVVIVLRYAQPDGTLKNAVYEGRDPRTRTNLMRFECRSAINAHLPQWKREVQRMPEYSGLEYVRADCVTWTPDVVNELLRRNE